MVLLMKKAAYAFIFVLLVLVVQVACAQHDVLSIGLPFMTVSSPSPTGTILPIPTATESPSLTPPPSIPTPSPSPIFIPKPSVPEFTLRLIASFPEKNKTTIELTIKNQPFDKDNIYHYSLVYTVRIRTSDENWTDLYNAEDGYPPQSGSDYTVLSYVSGEIAYYPSDDYPLAPSTKVGIIPSYGQVDFQVQAVVGYRTRSLAWLYGRQGLPYVFEGESSDWSDAQTVTIGESQTSSPEPTALTSPTPYNEPPPSEQEVFLGVAITVVVIVAGLGLLIYLVRRK
jgi:hypothetical protein